MITVLVVAGLVGVGTWFFTKHGRVNSDENGIVIGIEKPKILQRFTKKKVKS